MHAYIYHVSGSSHEKKTRIQRLVGGKSRGKKKKGRCVGGRDREREFKNPFEGVSGACNMRRKVGKINNSKFVTINLTRCGIR